MVSGYAGGQTARPTYHQVCEGTTGHAEVIQVEFDPSLVTYEKLLDLFWACHDPTTANRQGADVGTQYRSIILTHNDGQNKSAVDSREKAQADFRSPIVTEIVPLVEFFPAEDYHQNYYNDNKGAPYCQVIIGPKLAKLGIK